MTGPGIVTGSATDAMPSLNQNPNSCESKYTKHPTRAFQTDRGKFGLVQHVADHQSRGASVLATLAVHPSRKADQKKTARSMVHPFEGIEDYFFGSGSNFYRQFHVHRPLVSITCHQLAFQFL